MTAAWSPANATALVAFCRVGLTQNELQTTLLPARNICNVRSTTARGIDSAFSGFKTVSGKSSQSKPTVPVRAARRSHSDTTAVRGGCSALSKRCPYAPRLILLDEAFIGIDKPTRARLMGLLVSFDLDFVMTSELEWGCYANAPGAGICQLATAARISRSICDEVGMERAQLQQRIDGNGA